MALGDLVAVGLRFVRTIDWDADVIGLRLGQLGEFDTELFQVESCDFLVEVLGKHVDLLAVLARFAFVPKFKLGQNLVGEAAAHDKAWVAGGAAQVQ